MSIVSTFNHACTFSMLAIFFLVVNLVIFHISNAQNLSSDRNPRVGNEATTDSTTAIIPTSSPGESATSILRESVTDHDTKAHDTSDSLSSTHDSPENEPNHESSLSHGSDSHGSSVSHGSASHAGNSTGHSEGHGGGHHEYQVANFDFAHVATPYIISLWILLASVTKIGFHMSGKLSSVFPESCLLITLGVVVGVILYFTEIAQHEHYHLTSTTFFLFLLPPIVLEAGYFMPNRAFFDNLGTILLFAVIGTIWNTVTIGVSLWAIGLTGLYGVPLNILQAFVFSALISAVDPVAVLAVFEEIHVNEILHIVVFGESLLNDAVTVVLYHMFESYSAMGQENIMAKDVIAGIGSFFIVALGGTLIGVVWAVLIAFVTKFTEHVRVIEPIFVFVMAYLSYLSAELFHFSGILAITFCGIAMKQYVEANISQKSHTTVKYFMKMLSNCCETIIFMFLGLSTVTDEHDWNTWFVILTLIFCLLYRSIGVIIFTWMANYIRLIRLNKVEQFVMAYGGLRGGVSFSLVILLDKTYVPQKKMMLTATLAVVFFTVFVQGITIKPLVAALNVKRRDKRKPTMNEQINERFFDHLMAGIEDIAGHHGHHYLRDKFEYYDAKYFRPLLMRNAVLTRNPSILHVHSKLNLKDAMEYLTRYGSFHKPIPTENSLLRLLRSQSNLGSTLTVSESMYSLPSNDSSPCLDMHGLDTTFSKKVADDSKIHHILMDSMFQPRKRVSTLTGRTSSFTPQHKKYVRSQLQEGDSQQNISYKNKINLRHLITAARFHTYYCSRSQASNNNKNQNKNNFLRVEDIIENKPRKNVSFADQLGDAGGPLTKQPSTLQLKSSDDELEEGGITFTARPSLDIDTSKEKSSSPEPTAVERTLPWKRETEHVPLSSSKSFFSISREDVRKQDEFPGWTKSKEYPMYGSSPNSFSDYPPVHTSSPSDYQDLPSPYYGTKYTLPFESFSHSPPFCRKSDDFDNSSNAYTESTAPISTSTDSSVTRGIDDLQRSAYILFQNETGNSGLDNASAVLSENASLALHHPVSKMLDSHDIPMIDDENDDDDNLPKDTINIPTIKVEYAGGRQSPSNVIEIFSEGDDVASAHTSYQTVFDSDNNKKKFWNKIHYKENPLNISEKHMLSGTFDVPTVIIHSSNQDSVSESAL